MRIKGAMDKNNPDQRIDSLNMEIITSSCVGVRLTFQASSSCVSCKRLCKQHARAQRAGNNEC